MAQFSFLSPLNQPYGERRLLDDLKRHLGDKKFKEWGFVVAFAKVGPLYRLQELIEDWKAAGKQSTGIFGIDHNGTSVQALQFAAERFTKAYYTQYRGHSFHPKIYWFKGPTKAVVFVGSNNLTVGGTELNFEAGIELEFSLPEDLEEFSQIEQFIQALLPENCAATRELTAQSLLKLVADGLLLDEARPSGGGGGFGRGYRVAHPPDDKFKLPVKPASSLPSHILFGKKTKKKELVEKSEAIKAQTDVVDVTKPLVPVTGIVMQIKPHHNGEIFLSKTAAEQNPRFFGMPFTGKTTPKKGENAAYPQRDPDPVCNIAVFGKDNAVLFAVNKFLLNTVFYTKKSEIRVTASPLVPHVPEYSILVMTLSEEIGVDYDMQIYTPESTDYGKWLAVCDQAMPGGGKEPRHFGWF